MRLWKFAHTAPLFLMASGVPLRTAEGTWALVGHLVNTWRCAFLLPFSFGSLSALAPRSTMAATRVADHGAPVGRGQLPHQLLPQEGKQAIRFTSCCIIF